MRKWQVAVTIVACLILASMPAVAQIRTNGQIDGVVTDSGGVPLPGATIVVTGPALQGERSVVASADGEFHILALPTGVYRVEVTFPNYQTKVYDNVNVLLGKITGLEVQISKADASQMVEHVTVTAEYPLLEKKTADVSTNLSSKALETIPTAARSFRDLTKFVPSITSVELNTSTGSTTGYPSIRGEGQYGDNYLIDGLTVRDPAVYTTGTPLNYDAIEEVQIITDGFSPEYGTSLGGSVNVITKSGSNTFGGEVAYLYDSDKLSADFSRTLLANPKSYDNSAPYLNVGGPILKDKLWYFFSYNRTDSSDTFASVDKPGYGTLAEGITDVTDDLYFGKATWAATANHNLSINYTYRDGSTEGLGASNSAPEARRVQDVTDKRLRFNYQAILGPNSVFELKYGTVKRDINTVPMSLGAANYELVSLGVNINNAWREQIDNRERDDWAAQFTQFFNPGGAWGSHEVKAGIEYHEPQQNSGDNFSGINEDVFSIGTNPAGSDFGMADTFNQGAKFNFVSGSDVSSMAALIPSVLNEYRSSGILQNRNEEYGYFLQDRWEIGRWNILAGFRADKQKGFNDAGEIFSQFDFSDAFSPRASITWDVKGDGKNVMKTGWGRFYDVNSTRFGEFANTREAFSFRTYEWAGPGSGMWPSGEDFRDHIDTGDNLDIHNPANWGFTNEQSNESNPVDYTGVTGPSQVERFLLEYNRLLGSNYVLKARYVNGRSRSLIDDVHFLYNDYRVINTDLKRRDYESFEVEFNGNPTPNLSFNTSWVHSAARGTNPGQFEASGFLGTSGSGNGIGVYLDRPPSDPQFWCDLYGPNCVPSSWSLTDPTRDYNNDGMVNQFDRDMFIQTLYGGLGGLDGDDGWYGFLPYSIDDQIKLHGRFTIPQWQDTYLDLFMQWASGYHTQRRGYQSAYGDYLTFSEQNLIDYVGACTNFADCETVYVQDPIAGRDFSNESGLSRGSLTNVSFWSVDATIGKLWQFSGRYGIEFRAEIFNITNNQDIVAIQDRAVSDFGDALTRIQPRRARISARFTW